MDMPLRFIADIKRATPRTYLPDCPAGHARVAILTPEGALSHSKFEEVIDGVVYVRLFGKRVRAEPCEPIAGTAARFSVTMPRKESPE